MCNDDPIWTRHLTTFHYQSADTSIAAKATGAMSYVRPSYASTEIR
jgi:hypothetical protein